MMQNGGARIATETVPEALQVVSEVCRNHQISALDDFIESCRAFAREETLNVAVFGRFKAGKSSFLNHLLGGEWLPTGAIPVTAVVTEIAYGPHERAEVVFKDGTREPIAPERMAEFLSESQNPGNRKQALRVRLELTSMRPYRGIRFVDTPGLESVLEHNTEASLEWLPNVGLALVAVSVDPPLSRHDIELIRRIGRFTPDISLLLTKIDLLQEGEWSQVEDFVRTQLARHSDRQVPIFPYSTRPGFEDRRERIQRELLFRARSQARAQHGLILHHKLDSLRAECCDYLRLALTAAERDESEREQLRRRVLGEKHSIEDTRQALRLIARHAAGSSRTLFERSLEKEEPAMREALLAELDREFPRWAASLRLATLGFENWLADALAREIGTASSRHREEFVEPIRRVNRQLSRSLQDFRNRLAERALSALGVPLRTSEAEPRLAAPASPDVRAGKIFDRNWELLSFLLPMRAIRLVVKQHFQRKVAGAVSVNLSRLATQWEEVVNGSIAALEREAIGRLDELVATVDRLIASAQPEAPRLRADLLRLQQLRGRSSC